jgi:hypothetical protein
VYPPHPHHHHHHKTIKKRVKNDGLVKVYTGNNLWETRLTKDTVCTIGKKINSILEYVVQNSTFSERDRRKLSKFGEYSSYFDFLNVIGDSDKPVKNGMRSILQSKHMGSLRFTYG